MNILQKHICSICFYYHTGCTMESCMNECLYQENSMLHWMITFFILAVIAAVLGFGGLAGTFASIAKFLAILFVILFVASLLHNLITGRKATPPL